MSQNVLVGTVDVSLGAQTYGGSSPTDYEEQATGSNGFGVRMTPVRVYHNWFTQAFTVSGRDETLFKSGHRVIFSISNMNKITSSFTFKTMWNTTTYDAAITAMFTRIAAMPFDSAVAGGSTYGGLTQPYIDIDLEHEIDRETPHPGIKLYPRSTNGVNTTDTATDYIKAYQKLWTLWQAAATSAGVSPTRVRFNWIITPYNLSTADRFYPGDQYVDVVSYDPYATSPSQSFASLCASLGVFTHARLHKKPIGFGEFMCLHTADSSALQQWFVDAATTINALTDIPVEYLCLWPAGPAVEGASYYTFNFNKVADTNNHAFPLAHAGIASMITAFGSNAIRTSVGQALPVAPTGLAGSSSTDGTQETLTWSNNPSGDNAIGWKVFRADGWVGAGGIVVATLNAATPTSFTDTGRTPGGKYTYWIACVNATGTGPVSNTPIQIQTNNPSDPTNRPAISSSSGVATVGSQSVVFTAAATSPLGRPLTYNWAVTSGAGVVIDTFSGSSVTRTYQTMGHYTWVLTVADNGTPQLFNTASDAFDIVLSNTITPLNGWNMDPFLPGRFLELHGQALLAIFNDQDTKLGGLLSALGEAGELFGTVGQTFDPSYAGASATADLASGKIIWAKLKCRSTTISSIGTITTQAQIGTGSKVAVCDVNGNFLTFDGTNATGTTLYSGTNVDAWLTHTAGDTLYALDTAISGLTQGQDIMIVVFSPSATVTQYAKFLATEAPVAAAVANGNTAIPIWGSATGQTDITNPPPFGSYAAINRPYFYINA